MRYVYFCTAVLSPLFNLCKADRRVQLLRNFDWCLGKPEEPWREHNYMGIFVHSNMWVMATERTLNH